MRPHEHDRRAAGVPAALVPYLAIVIAGAGLLALVTCLDALLLHDVPAEVEALAFLGTSIGCAGLLEGSRCAVALARTSRALRRLARAATPLPGHPGVSVLPTDRPAALCAGLLHPRVLLTQGAVKVLSPAALEAVVAHEFHHARRRDGLREGLAEVLAAALFLRPTASAACQTYRTLLEFGADQAAAPTREGRRGLAAAMVAFDGSGHSVDPVRVDRLLEREFRLELPRRTLVTALGLLGLLLSTAGACTAVTGCVDIFVLREDDATAARVGLLPLLLLASLALLAAVRRRSTSHDQPTLRRLELS